MKSGGGLLFTAWLLLMAWCLFSNRVSTATVVGNSYLQMVTCKYLIFCSLDKYKLLVPHQVCAFAQERLIELKSTLVGTLEAWLTLGHTPLNSHRCCPTAVPSLVEQLPCISIQTAEIGLKFGGRTPDGTPHACPVPAVLTKAYIHAHTHFAKKGYFFNGKRKFSKSRKGGWFLFFNNKFWKIEFPQFNYPMWWYDDMTYIYKYSILNTDVLYIHCCISVV